MADKKLVLSMIVKNEAHVIERCLASLLPLELDYYVICDTGSTDGTQEKIRNFFGQFGIEGKVLDIPWENFAHNRSIALAEARPHGDYTIMIDADEVMEYAPEFDARKFREALIYDLYNVYAQYGAIKYHRPQLTSNHKEFIYKGVLHEYVDCKDPIESRGFAPWIINRPIQDGARSKDPQKYQKDAEVFEKALASGTVEESEVNRYHFYLAQSYRDAGMMEKALEAYMKRASLKGWDEEVYYSLMQAATIRGQLNHSIDEVIKLLWHAYLECPRRAESLCIAAKVAISYCRFDQAYIFAKESIGIRYPEGGLFVINSIYDWESLYQFSVASFWTGRYRDCVLANKQLLAENKVPSEMREKIEMNLKIATEKLVNEGNR
jgi:glycosyltransferase involved in cell wall biosynthesis